MACITVDERIVKNLKSDNLEAMLNSIIEAELSKDVSQVNTELVNECVDALISIEQDDDNSYNVLIPLVSSEAFLKQIKATVEDKPSWKKLNVFARVGIVAAIVASTTFAANAAVLSATGINVMENVSDVIYDTLKEWGVIKTHGIDIIDGEDDDDEETTTTTTKPSTTNAVEEAVTPTPTATSTTTSTTTQTTEPVTRRGHIDVVDGDDDDEEETTKPTTTQPTTQAPTEETTETTTKKPIEPTTEAPIVTPTPEEDKVVFTGLSAEFNDFKTDYIYGEELSYDGLVLKANYSNGLKEIVDLEDCSYTKNLDMNVTADYELRIIYNNSVVKINITVRPDEFTRGSQICQNDLYDYMLTKNGAYVTAYRGEETSISLNTLDGNDVIAIGSNVFAGSNIRFITAENVERIFPAAFKNCDSLVDCYTPRATYIGDNAFTGCTNLKEAVFSESLTYLGEAAYKDSGIEKLYVPSAISVIPKSLCENCENLESVTFNGKVTAVDSLAFSNCTALTTVNGTADIVKVSDWAFADDTNVNFNAKLDKLESAGKYAFSKCNKLDIGTLPSLTQLDTGSFEYCYLLTSIEINESITEIPNSAFSGTRLSSLTLHNKVKSIGDYAFMSTMLTEINIPAGVEKIGTRALYTTRMRKAYFNNTDVDIDDDAFYAGSRLTFYVRNNSTAMKYAEDNDINYELLN